MSMLMTMRNIVSVLHSVGDLEGHFGANRELFEAPWLFISPTSPKQQLWEHSCGLGLALLSLALACGCEAATRVGGGW